MKLGSLVVEITADSAKFVAGVADTEIKLDNLTKRARTAVNAFGKYSAAAVSAGAAVTAALYTSAAQAIDAQAKLAQRLDTTSASIATLERAGGLAGVSLEKVTQGSSDLTRRLSQAATIGGPVKKALDAIGLSAQELQALPLDQRIEQINQALIRNADASQRAAIAGQLFGEEGSLFMTQINPDVLAQARKETELFGLALSDVDAAKVEMANDAFSTFGMAADGIVQQLTVQLAPIVKAVADAFVGAADDAGGFGNVAISAFEKVINAAAFVMDAADGIKRVFQLTADGIIVAISYVVQKVSDSIAWVLEKISKIPGVDYSDTVASLRGLSADSQSIIDEAMNNIDATLSRPMPGDSLRQFVEDARKAGEEAAKATIAAREAIPEAGAMGPVTSPEEEARRKQLKTRIEAIRQANLTERELLLEKQAAEIEAINAHEQLKQENYQAWADLMLESKLRHEDEITELDRRASEERKRQTEQEAAAKQQILSQAFSGLTTLMNSESKKMFEIGKTAAIAQSIVSTYQGMTKALELGYPLGLVAAAAIGATGFAQVQSIRSQSFKGGGGGATSSTATQQVSAQSTPTGGNPAVPQQTMMVSGIDEGELFTGGRVRSIVSELLEYQRNGGQVILA